MERERASVLVTECSFYLSQLGGLYGFFLIFVFVGRIVLFPVAVWPRAQREASVPSVSH